MMVIFGLLCSLLCCMATTLSAQQASSAAAFTPQDTALVLLTDSVPSILVDVRYATTDNFTGKILYPTAKVYVRAIVAHHLAQVQHTLAQHGYALKVFDGYRPLSVQKTMWALVPDERYVANPAKGSRHNRGAAVDVTIVRLSDGTELDMGTPYDSFTERAHADYQHLPQRVLDNRKLLADTMKQHGFLPFATEWWHFDFYGWEHFPILDIPIQ